MYKLEGKDIVISGWENGIADDPYSGIADIRNANISSTPKEVCVNFSTTLNSFPSLSAVSITSADTTTEELTITSTASLATGMAIYISGTNLPTGIAAGTATAGPFYWVKRVSATKMQLWDTYVGYIQQSASVVNLTTTGTPGDWTFTTINIAIPRHFTTDGVGGYWMLDSKGQTWRTEDQSLNWAFTGNKVPTSTYTNGNGLLYFEATTGATPAVKTGYIFIFHDSSIDYTPSNQGDISWNYQWNPSAATVGAYNATPTAVLKTALGTHNSHETGQQSSVFPDGRAYYCDSNYIGRFYQTDPTVVFSTTSASTYTFTQTPVIPFSDICQTIAPSGTNMLIGGAKNLIYSWNKVDVSNNGSPLIVPENNIVKLITVNTITYAFVGNRGRIYYTNGTNIDLFKKIPDNISGKLEPYFIWGGAAYNRNRLYFGFSVTSNDSATTHLTYLYKGLWSIDLDTKALIQTNDLSGTNVYASAIIGISATSVTSGTSPALDGAGLYVGWSNFQTAQTSSGVDVSSETPYSNNETYIISDVIPVGTYLDNKTFSQVEWKTAVPLGSNGAAETIALYFTTTVKRGALDNFVYIGSTTTTGSSQVGSTTGTTVGGANVSDYYQANFQKSQWLQIKAVLNSTASATTATWNRLTEIRIRDFKK